MSEKKEQSQSYFSAPGNPEFISNCRMDYTPSLRSKLGSHVKWSNFFGTGQRLHCHTKYREAKVMPAVGAGQEKHSDIIPNTAPQVQEPSRLTPGPNEHDQPLGDEQEPADGEDDEQRHDGLAADAHTLAQPLVNMFKMLAVTQFFANMPLQSKTLRCVIQDSRCKIIATRYYSISMIFSDCLSLIVLSGNLSW